ncbi:MAG: outer membrane protein assembly factor BamA [Bacteroidia bacterium]|nr:outer membrane protein assembly factor BamA [Bacteroidia bacterium]
MIKKIAFIVIIMVSLVKFGFSQNDTVSNYATIDYGAAKTYIVAGFEVTGTSYYDKGVIQIIAGISIGQKIKIPSDDVTKAITSLWKQKLFDDIRLKVQRIENERIWLELALKEKPRLSTFSIIGVRKGKAEDISEALTMKSGQIINQNLLVTIEREIKKFYADKGRSDTKVKFEMVDYNAVKNTNRLKIFVTPGPKIKIDDIIIEGNAALTDKQIRGQMKETKWKKRLFAKSKFIEENFNDDKQKVIAKYLSLGYRDIQIVSDSVWRGKDQNVNIKMVINEGLKYYFRNIKFIGNSKYKDADLHRVLNIKRGDIYDQTLLDERLNMSQQGLDVSTLYMDDGYLFFRIEPVEVLIENDSIDLEIRITEGEQARINKVTVKGNTKTSDHVILRELRTKPGQLFSRSDITRSLRELSQIGYFNPEALGVNPVPNPATGTVDIEYKVEERANDQIELSGGWGAGMIIGTLGLTINNFSARKVSRASAWNPIPSGDGQRISLRAQTNGTFFQSYSASFTEPWLGGKKPNALSVSVFHSRQTNGFSSDDGRSTGLFTSGLTVGLGKRLKWPDDYFVLQYQGSFQQYDHKYSDAGLPYISSIAQGISNNISLKVVLGRNSTDQIIYPRSGSNISLSLQVTPPYSLFANVNSSQNMRWLEFHKWKFDATFFNRILGDLVFMTRVNFGAIGNYNSSLGITPFERFWVGGAGLTGFNLDGRELVALRGYQDNTLTPLYTDPFSGQTAPKGATVYNRYTMELRYPISLNPQATVFPLVFAEAGNAQLQFKDFNPFKLYRSYGMGVRIFLPMFGMIGLDYGWGIDDVPLRQGVNGGNFHFLIGQQF